MKDDDETVARTSRRIQTSPRQPREYRELLRRKPKEHSGRNGQTQNPNTRPDKDSKRMAKQTDEQDIFSLLEEIEKRKQPAIEQLTTEIEERITKLARLGVSVILQDENVAPTPSRRATGAAKTPAKAKTVSSPSANYQANKKCPTCDGMLGHDGRAHRTNKEKFTPDQLAALGLQAPAGTAVQATL